MLLQLMINTFKKINDDKFTMPVFKIQETIITTTFFLTLFYFALSHLQLLMGIESHTNDTKNKRPRHSEWDAWWILTRGEGPWRGWVGQATWFHGVPGGGPCPVSSCWDSGVGAEEKQNSHQGLWLRQWEGPSTQRRVSRRVWEGRARDVGSRGPSICFPQGKGVDNTALGPSVPLWLCQPTLMGNFPQLAGPGSSCTLGCHCS